MPLTTEEERNEVDALTQPCASCGEEVDLEDNDLYDDLCASCFEEDVLGEEGYWCETCGDDHLDPENLPPVNEWPTHLQYRENYVRERVYGEHLTWCASNPPRCDNCEDMLYDDDAHYWSGGSNCSDCEHCNECYNERSVRSRPQEPFSRCDPGLFRNYTFMPRLRFRNVGGQIVAEMEPPVDTSTLYMGMELEMEGARERLEQINSHINGDIRDAQDENCLVWFKYDASLDINGVEMVSHPATFDWWMNDFPWDGLSQLAKEGAHSYQSGRCGIHIHVSLESFTSSHLMKFLAFHYQNSLVCQAVGQRRSVTYGNWANWLTTRPNLVEYAKNKAGRGSHSSAVTFSDKGTIELRYFRGNLSPERVKKNLQWVEVVYQYTKQVRGVEMDRELRFSRLIPFLIEHQDRYPELVQFLGDRAIRDGHDPELIEVGNV